jgi:hypothetical protein
VKAKVIAVERGAPETISKSLRQYLSNITGKHEIKELHTTTTLGSKHILLKVLCKVKVKVKQSRYRPRVAQRVPGS